MKVGMGTRTLMDYNLEATIKIAHKIGYEGVVIFGVPKHLPHPLAHFMPVPQGMMRRVMDVNKLKKLCDDLGIKVITLNTYIGGYQMLGDRECEKQVQASKDYVEMAYKLECSNIRENLWGTSWRDAREDHWLRAAYYLQKVADYAEDYGVNIIFQHHNGLEGTVDSSLKLLRMVDRPNVGIHYSPANMISEGPENIGPDAVRKLGKHIVNVVVKDRGLLGADTNVINYVSIVKTLKEIGYDGFLTQECHVEPDENMSAPQIVENEYREIKKLIESV